jgi:hypothetical protein
MQSCNRPDLRTEFRFLSGLLVLTWLFGLIFFLNQNDIILEEINVLKYEFLYLRYEFFIYMYKKKHE